MPRPSFNTLENDQSLEIEEMLCQKGAYRPYMKKKNLLQDRVFWLMVFFIATFSFISLRVLMLGFSGDHPIDQTLLQRDLNINIEKKARQDIVDRNGTILATDVSLFSLYADTRFMFGTRQIAQQLHTLFPDLEEDALSTKLNSQKAFIWIKRDLTPAQMRAVYQLGIPGLSFVEEFKRIYPNQTTVSHVLGAVDIDNKGIAGIEYYLEQSMPKSNTPTPVQLSLDLRLQYALYDELSKGFRSFSPLAAMGMIMNARTGEILAMTSLPGFDPNTYRHAEQTARFNRMTSGAYEMGSTMKVITLASALDMGAVQLGQLFDVQQPLKYGRFTIHDYHPVNHPLTTEEVLTYSSNIGIAKIAMRMGARPFRFYLRKLGLLTPLTLEIPEVGRPILPRRWTDISVTTVSYGHGIAISPLQALTAFATIVNGGYAVQPTLLKNEENIRSAPLLKKETSAIMRHLLRDVVTTGTGKKANITSYAIIGKTGTAEKNENGHYVKNKNMSSFISAFPADNPHYVMLIIFDEPHATPETYGYSTAGWNAVPVTASLVERIAPILGMRPLVNEGRG